MGQGKEGESRGKRKDAEEWEGRGEGTRKGIGDKGEGIVEGGREEGEAMGKGKGEGEGSGKGKKGKGEEGPKGKGRRAKGEGREKGEERKG